MSTVMYCFRAENKQIFDNQVETIRSNPNKCLYLFNCL